MPGVILDGFGVPGRFQEAPGAHRTKAPEPKVDFLAENDAPRVDLGIQLGPKMAPKSNLLGKNQHKMEKNRSKRGSRKNMEN